MTRRRARLVIPAGILRIPVFFAPVVFFFNRKHDSCSSVTFSERHQESCLYGAYVGSYVGIKRTIHLQHNNCPREKPGDIIPHYNNIIVLLSVRAAQAARSL